MKHFFLAALLGTAIGATAPASAQSAQAGTQAAALVDADPALWVVRDEDTTIYLFGTFHMLDGRQQWFDDEVKRAFDSSQEAVFEAILPDDTSALAPLIRKYAVDPSGKRLSTRLSAKTWKKFARELQSAGIPVESLDPYEPWYATMALGQISTSKLGLEAGQGPEAILTRAARQRGMKIGELEGTEFQLGLFDTMPEAQQIAFLEMTLDSMDETAGTLMPMLKAWSSGDVDALVKILNDGIDDDPALYELLFTRRNSTWAGWIAGRLAQPGTVFVAVGAGHLAGKHSVQQLLGQRGIASARVAY
jgi:uncharacterized protein